MKIRWVLLSGLPCLLAGVGATYEFVSNFCGQMRESFSALRTSASTVNRVAVLERLRAGKISDAVSLEESLLEGDIMSASAYGKDGHSLTKNAVKALALERQAMGGSGYEPGDLAVRKLVGEVLQSLPTEN